MKVYELLDEEKKFIKYTLAKDKLNREVSALHSDACKWCLLGAIFNCYWFDTKEWQRVNKLVTDALNTSVHISLSAWADTHSYEEVIALCKKLDI